MIESNHTIGLGVGRRAKVIESRARGRAVRPGRAELAAHAGAQLAEHAHLVRVRARVRVRVRARVRVS